MWATSQFVGCAGARMFGGFLVTCYYHPRGNQIGESVFEQGKDEYDACTECSELRSSCSRILTGLCGLDDEYILQNSARTADIHVIFYMTLPVFFLT